MRFTKVLDADSHTVVGRMAVMEIEEFGVYGESWIVRRDAHDWQGGMGGREAIRCVRDGHQESVRSSEEFLESFLDMNFKAKKWETVSDVAGGAVNIGAHVAGLPQSMRRRQAKPNAFAPLTIFCDLVSSAQITAATLKKRGAATVALARMLASTRPVTVYAVGGKGGGGHNGFVMVRVPMNDMGRTAFVLAHTAAQRAVMYGTIDELLGVNVGGWPLHGDHTYRTEALRIYSSAIQEDPANCLYVPAIYLTEDASSPTEWVKKMLAKYGALDMEGD